MKKRYIFLLILLFIVVLAFFRMQWMHMFHHSTVKIENGQIDLRDWNPEENSILLLNGEWEFYPSQLLMEEPKVQVTNHLEKKLIPVPGGWNEYLEDIGSTPYGYGTYHISLKVNSEIKDQLSLYIPSIRSASEIFINGEYVASSGNVATTKEEYIEENLPYSVSFKPDEEGLVDIFIHVANFKDIRSSGIVRSIKFGTERAIAKDTNLSLMMQVLASGILFIHSIYAIILYFLGKLDKRLLYFAGLLFSLTIVNMITSDEKLLNILINIDYDWGFRLSNGFGVLAMFLLFKSFDHSWLPYWQLINRIISISYTVIILATFLLMAGQIISIYSVYFIVIIPSTIILFMTIFKSVFDSITQNLFLLLSTLTIFHQFIWYLYWREIGISVAYYPFDLIIALALLSSVWFKEYFAMHSETKKLATQLQEVNENKDQFLANTAHEFKNPLHGIINMSQSILNREEKSLQEQSIHELETVLNVSLRMSHLLNDLIDVTYLRDGKPIINEKKIHLQPIVISVIDMLQFLANSKPIELVNEVDHDFPLIYADRNRLIQIIYNLLHNAIKYTDEGKITINATVKNDRAVISIIDTGIGMDKDFLKRIFLPYEKENSRGLNEGGLGLGLNISKQLVELHGGQLLVESILGEGTTLTFSVKLATEVYEDNTEKSFPNEQENNTIFNSHHESTFNLSDEELIALTNHIMPTIQNEEKINVIVVDDDPVNLQVIQSMLQDDKYEITPVLSGKQALKKLSEHEWDIVISDIMMPDMSGYELTKQIREKFLFTELPILLLTARNHPRDIQTGFLYGANDYVTKPVERLELQARVDALTTAKQSAKKQLQLEAAWLQAQIKPHFIFNTLNSILALSDVDIEKMRDVLYDLSSFLRHKFQYHNIDELIPLEEELNIIRSYIKIEQVRFANRLHVEWNIEKTNHIKVPFLTIQPLVENAIFHGVMKKAAGGIITISVINYDQYVKISVQDNGVGMDENSLKKIFKLNESNQKSVGISNTNKRLIRHFGEGLQFESEIGKGTTVSFIVYK